MNPADISPVFAWVDGLFSHYGYWVVLVALVCESIVLIGAFTPGEVALLIAAAYSAQGKYDPWAIWAIASVGGIIGSSISYYIGRHGGLPVIIRYGHRIGVSEERIAASRAYFEAHGAKTVFIGRWATGFKAWVPALAGASHMSLPVFFGYTAAASMTWAALVTTLGHLFGSNMKLLLRIVKSMGWGVLILVALAVAFVVWRRRRVGREVHELAESLEIEPRHGDAPAVGSTKLSDADAGRPELPRDAAAFGRSELPRDGAEHDDDG